jgi:hypothetical protein
VITSVKDDWYLGPLQVLGSSGSDHCDLQHFEFQLSLGLVGVRPTEDVVDLLMTSGKSLFMSSISFSCSAFLADLRTSSANPCNLFQS